MTYDAQKLEAVLDMYEKIGQLLIENNLPISFMESCTGGFLAALLTNTEGISSVFREGFITYCNEVKIKNGVGEDIIRKYGVYSGQTARAMAKTAQKKADARIGVGITGCFGRVDPANPLGIPGEAFFAVAFEDHLEEGKVELPPIESRFSDRILAAEAVGQLLLSMLKK